MILQEENAKPLGRESRVMQDQQGCLILTPFMIPLTRESFMTLFFCLLMSDVIIGLCRVSFMFKKKEKSWLGLEARTLNALHVPQRPSVLDVMRMEGGFLFWLLLKTIQLGTEKQQGKFRAAFILMTHFHYLSFDYESLKK